MRQTRPEWRLKKTLARHLAFRPIEDDDLPYVWAAYRGGALGDTFPDGLNATEFKAEFEDLVVIRYDAAWTLFAETKKGFIAVGVVLGFWPHHDAAAFMIADMFVWFPWSSTRNRVESAVNFINSIRSEIPMLGFARLADKPFFEVIARHGIVRRIGKSENVFGDEQASVWETRTP